MVFPSLVFAYSCHASLLVWQWRSGNADPTFSNTTNTPPKRNALPPLSFVLMLPLSLPTSLLVYGPFVSQHNKETSLAPSLSRRDCISHVHASSLTHSVSLSLVCVCVRALHDVSWYSQHAFCACLSQQAGVHQPHGMTHTMKCTYLVTQAHTAHTYTNRVNTLDGASETHTSTYSPGALSLTLVFVGVGGTVLGARTHS